MLQVQNIYFSYKDKPNINGVSFSVMKGQNLAVIGESGCGKSTLLKLIYGLYDLNGGHIFWNKKEVLGPKFHLIPGMEYMKYLAQDFDLMPFITVAENVGKYLSNIYAGKKKERIAELLEIVEMTDYADVRAQFLSGGQMQRVALARVLALEPEVLLLDEPFSHIDNFRKNSLRRKLFAYLKERQITTIVATHDSSDVLSFSDEVIVMQNGGIIASDTPKNIYQNPGSRYIASLFGDVNKIMIEGKAHFIYPHQLRIVPESAIRAEISKCYYKGSHYLIEARSDNQIIFFENDSTVPENSVVFLQYEGLT